MGYVGTGITITFASGFLAEILDVTPPGMSREMIQMSHQGTGSAGTSGSGGWHVFKPARLIDPGSAECTLAFQPSDTPPILNAFESVTITFPDSASTPWEFQGALSEYTPSAPFEDKMTADVTIKASGAISIGGTEIT